MRSIDYEIGWKAGKATITARSDRAKNRTPEPIVIDRAAALDLVRDDEARGRTLLGHQHIDEDKRLVKNGYIIIGTGGRLIPAGQDWGPSETVYENGDTIRGGSGNGKEGVIERIVTGKFAQKMGFGLVFVLGERDISNAN